MKLNGHAATSSWALWKHCDNIECSIQEVHCAPERGGKTHGELCYYIVHVSCVLIAPTTALDVFQGMYRGHSAALKGLRGASPWDAHIVSEFVVFSLCADFRLLISLPHWDSLSPPIIIFSLYSLLQVSVILKCNRWCGRLFVSVSLRLKHTLKYELGILKDLKAPVVWAWLQQK